MGDVSQLNKSVIDRVIKKLKTKFVGDERRKQQSVDSEIYDTR